MLIGYQRRAPHSGQTNSMHGLLAPYMRRNTGEASTMAECFGIGVKFAGLAMNSKRNTTE